jgi:hypothetical protein
MFPAKRSLAGSTMPARYPPPINVIAVPRIDREGGHAAKFKLIKLSL